MPTTSSFHVRSSRTMSDPTYSPIDSPLMPKLDFDAVPRQLHFYQPPPSSASSSLQNSTASLQTSLSSTYNCGSRKRPRHESKSPSATNMRTPTSLANTRYRTHPHRNSYRAFVQPHPQQVSHMTSPSHPGKCPERTGADINRGQESDQDDDDDEMIGQAFPNSPNIRDGLGNVIYRFAGVAGKVWKNWSTSFRGFCAGGGQTYELKEPILVESEKERWQVILNGKAPLATESVPGGFPEDDYIPNYMSHDHTNTPTRAAKRLRPDGGAVEKWTLIDASAARETSPSRQPRRRIYPPSHPTQRVARRPKGVKSPSCMSIVSEQSRSSPQHASYASTRTPTRSTAAMRNSPVSLEVQQHAARIRRKEAEEEANLKRLNSQLKAMIREGREALGTKYEIEIEMNEENIDPEDS